MGVCDFFIKNKKLVSGSGCSDANGDPVSLSSGDVTLQKGNCLMDFNYRLNGMDYQAALSVNRKNSAANGIYLVNQIADFGTLNLMKK